MEARNPPVKLQRLILGSDPGIASAERLRAMGFSTTLPVVELRQDNGSGGSKLVSLYMDAVGNAQTFFVDCYREAGATPLLVAAIDTYGRHLSRAQEDGQIGFYQQLNASAVIGNSGLPLVVQAKDSAGNLQTWLQLLVEQRVITDGSEAAKIYFQIMSGAALRSIWEADEDPAVAAQTWRIANIIKQVLTANYLRLAGGLRTGSATTDPATMDASAGLFAGVTPHAELFTGNGTGAFEECVVIRHAASIPSAALRRMGLLLKLHGEANTTQSDRMGGIILESSLANGATPDLFLVVANQKWLGVTSAGVVNLIAGTWQIGGTTVTPTVTEINRLAGVTSGVQTQLDAKVPTSRTITTNNGIQGGGTLAADKTFSLDVNGLTTIGSPAQLDANDMLPVWDNSASAHRKLGLQALHSTCIVSRLTNQAVAASTVVNVSFTDTDTWDPDAMHDPASNADRITIPTGMGGTYLINASGYMESVEAGCDVQMRMTVNNTIGTEGIWARQNVVTYQYFTYYLGVTGILRLAAGDIVRIAMFHNDSVSRNCRVSCAIVRISP